MSDKDETMKDANDKTNQSGASDSKPEEVTAIIRDYLEGTEKRDRESSEVIQRMWRNFEGKQNNKDTLTEKAEILARLIMQYVRLHTEGFASWGDLEKNSNSDIGDNSRFEISLGELFIEIASVYLSYVDRRTQSALNKEDGYYFVEIFQQNFIALSLKENYKENADLMLDTFISDLNKRLIEYAKYPFYLLKNKESESPSILGGSKGTLLGEFSRNVARMIGRENRIFTIEIMTNIVLRDFNRLQLEKLLA